MFGLKIPERGVHKGRRGSQWLEQEAERERGPVFNHKQEAETGCVVWKWGKAVNPQNLSPMKCLFQQDYISANP